MLGRGGPLNEGLELRRRQRLRVGRDQEQHASAAEGADDVFGDQQQHLRTRFGRRERSGDAFRGGGSGRGFGQQLLCLSQHQFERARDQHEAVSIRPYRSRGENVRVGGKRGGVCRYVSQT